MNSEPVIIQGGMGAAVSHWPLARAVSQRGQLGVVSGTALATVIARRLQDGDPGGHIRRALAAFPIPAMAVNVIRSWYIPNGLPAGTPYRLHPMYGVRSSRNLMELTIVAAFAEVFLAKEGHSGLVGINLLEKIRLPNPATLYGAMLAGVDYVLMGAGIPMEIPGMLDRLAVHEDIRLRIPVEEQAGGEEVWSTFSPMDFDADPVQPLKRPRFLAIIASAVLAQALVKKASGRVDGFVIEGPTAGGHNAPPRGAKEVSPSGEPVYGPKDAVDLEKIRALGLPFWLAGSYGSADKVGDALASGAVGVQVGTAFAFCEESGFLPAIKSAVLERVAAGTLSIFTDPLASPTGFPFKVADLPDSLADDDAYAARDRVCDLGYLREVYRKADGTLGYRCPSEPVEQFVKKGGCAEEAAGRKCLCNGLVAAVGHPQVRGCETCELPLITAGDDIVHLGQFLKAGATGYTADDVLDTLLQGVGV